MTFTLQAAKTENMEEGELSDSDCDQPQVAAAAVTKVNPIHNSEAHKAPSSTETFRRSTVPGLSSGSSDDDSDDGYPTALRKQKCRAPGTPTDTFTNPLRQSNARGPTGLGKSSWAPRGNEKACKGYVDIDGMDTGDASVVRKKDMWGSVIQEQDLEREISKFGVEPADLSVLSYRDVEAYQVPKRSQISYDFSDPSDNEGDSKKQEEKMEKGDEDSDTKAIENEDLFDMETFGTEAKKPLPKLSIKDRLGNVPCSDSDSDDVSHKYCKKAYVKSRLKDVDFDKELARYKLKRKRVDQKSKKKSVKDRLGKKSNRPEQPQAYISVTESDSTGVIVNALVKNLQEPKVGLMTRVVEILGAKKAIKMMNETATIESSGGLMIADGSRRRTPGGVFLFLLRNDRHVRKDELDLIFKEEREITAKERRRILRAKRAQLAELHRPQDAYMKHRSHSKKDQRADPAEKACNMLPEPTMELEDGEISDQDIGAEPDLEIQLD